MKELPYPPGMKPLPTAPQRSWQNIKRDIISRRWAYYSYPLREAAG